MKPNRYNLTVTTNRYNQPLHMDSKLGFVVAALSEKFDFDYEDAMKFLSKPLKKSKKNKGEAAEEDAKKVLFELMRSPDILVPIFGEGASEGVELINPETHEVYKSKEQIGKAAASFKGDAMIRLIKSGVILTPSIKAAGCAPPAILNHTNRAAKVFQGGALSHHLPILDKLILKMNKLREQGLVKEDIPIHKIPFENIEERECLEEILEYFVFDGTGRGQSACKANSVLFVNRNLSSWKFTPCFTKKQRKNYIKKIWSKLILSVRSKGLLPKKSKKYYLCQPWVAAFPGRYGVLKSKGALHIRIK